MTPHFLIGLSRVRPCFFRYAAFFFIVCTPIASSADKSLEGAAVFSKASPSTVLIRVPTSRGTSQGSGVAFRQGLTEKDKPLTWIVTNAHVVAGSDGVSVERSGSIYSGKVEYADSDLDIALVTIADALIPTAEINRMEPVSVGEKVYAIGSPLGLENSITEGIVSARREMNGVVLLQTSAPISKGNSGGGLFDSKGRLLGITTFRLLQGENLNFAVDARYASVVADALYASVLLRIYADELHETGRFTMAPEERKIVQSPALTKWLMKASWSDGTLMYRHILASLKGAHKDAITFTDALKDAELALVLFLVDSTQGNVRRPDLQQPSTSGGQSHLHLSCQVFNRNGGLEGDVSLRIDAVSRTVNNTPASFSDERIVFRHPSKTNVVYTLNRYTGHLALGTEQNPIVFSGKCVRVGDRLF